MVKLIVSIDVDERDAYYEAVLTDGLDAWLVETIADGLLLDHDKVAVARAELFDGEGTLIESGARR